MSFLKGIGLGDVLGTISPALGAVTGKGLGAELLPMLSPGLSMLLGSQHSGHNETAEPVAPSTPGYQAPELPAVTNHMQLLDPAILQAIIQHFQGGGGLSNGAPGVRSY
jgi:hypothetical protein